MDHDVETLLDGAEAFGAETPEEFLEFVEAAVSDDKRQELLARLSDPSPGHPRLRFPGDERTSLAWRSRQNGGKDLGAGCFEGIRNRAAHEDGLDLAEQVALEQLAAFSLLARWIDECTVEDAERAQQAVP